MDMKVYKQGRCTIMISVDNGLYHLSISTPNALPSYKEMKEARYRYLPDDIYMAEIFPPRDEFVNLHPYVRHLWQVDINNSNYGEKDE